MDIIQARHDPELFGRLVRDQSTWSSWDVLLKSVFALEMSAAERRTFKRLAARRPPSKPVRELWAIAGRRSGKTATAAQICVFLAAFRDHRPHLHPGERAVVMLLAVDRQQAKVALEYIRSAFIQIPMLAALVVRETRDGIELSNGASVEVHTNSFRAVRGRTLAGIVMDEVAYWRDATSATPDLETYRAILPGLATIPNALLVGISSPYRRAGLLYENHKNHYGRPGDVLVIQAATRDLNPTIPAEVVKTALARDPAAARSEWLAEFRDDISSFLDAEQIEAAVQPGMRQLAPRDGVTYRAFCDPAGTGKDEFSLAIGHAEAKRRVVDLVCGRQGKPHSIVEEYAAVLKSYRLAKVMGDRFAAGWGKDAFAEHGITYDYAQKTRSEIYLETAPLFATGLVAIPDDAKLIMQLRQLERRTSRAGRDVVDHPPSLHDDRANSCAGVLWLLGTGAQVDLSNIDLSANRELVRQAPFSI